MSREKAIEQLKATSPKVISITFSDDMGFEFKAVTADGVIFPEPGMLLDCENEDLPNDIDTKEAFENLLQGHHFSVVKWAELTDQDLLDLLNEVAFSRRPE